MATAAEVLRFWFGEPPATQARREWFQKDDDFDAVIRSRFGAVIETALTGGLADWDTTPCGALARIVVLDQFTRNSFRDTPRAFAGDALALAAAQELVGRGGDLALPPLQRWFAYLPFEHSESAGVQGESLRLFKALADADPALADARLYAQKHADVIQRFGRYPHRNAVLGRVSTAQEEAFLRQPGSRF
jgi:uncharacterized protein (DUF924 family)